MICRHFVQIKPAATGILVEVGARVDRVVDVGHDVTGRVDALFLLALSVVDVLRNRARLLLDKDFVVFGNHESQGS